MKELINQIALQKVKGIGPSTIRKLTADFKSTEAVFRATKNDFNSKYKVSGEKIYQLIQKAKSNHTDALKEYNHCQNKNYSLVSYSCADYPENLKNCPDAPQILYFSGNINLKEHQLISIVGTRSNSSYGQQVVKNILNSLKNYQITIVSGLAKGIDYLTHYYCVQNQIPNIAVLAHGLNYVFPKYHTEITKELKANGGLITEFGPFIKANKYHFPKRNRIIAGISSATLVIESPKKGGAMITARIAGSYNRDVFAVPGNIYSYSSKGCNQLIFNNEAHLLDSTESLINMMGLTKKKSTLLSENIPNLEKLDLQLQERKLLKQLYQEPNSDYDFLTTQLKISIEQLQSLLTSLEIKGHIEMLFGKKIKIIT